MQTPIPRTGCLFALEGIDGSGTTTQADLLARRLSQGPGGADRPAHLTREPSAGIVGQLLRQTLAAKHSFSSATIALLFAADRLDHFDAEIRPRLARGVDVVSDRYVYSSLAYQSVQDPARWVFAINSRAPSPDLTAYLRVSPDTAERRRARRGAEAELFDETAFQRKIAARYDELLGSSPAESTWQLTAPGAWARTGRSRSRFGRAVEVAVVDGEQSVESIHEQLWSLATTKLQQDFGLSKESVPG